MRLLTLVALLVGMFAFSARAEQLPVMVSIAPQKYIVGKIAGDLARIDVMVAPGADAHTFEPKPSQMAQAAKAVLYFAQGVEFEQVWLPRLAKNNRNLVVVDTLAGVQLMPLAEAHGQDHGQEGKKGGHAHADKEMDVHTWLSPTLVKTQAATMAEALVKADPANQSVYRANLAAFLAELGALDARIRLVLSGVPAGSEFIGFHPAWAYFARDYGLKETAIESGGREPGPRRLKEIIEQARETRAKAIFVQPQFSRKTAQTVAEAIGAHLVDADDLAEDWAGNLVRVAEALATALKKEGRP